MCWDFLNVVFSVFVYYRLQFVYNNNEAFNFCSLVIIVIYINETTTNTHAIYRSRYHLVSVRPKIDH